MEITMGIRIVIVFRYLLLLLSVVVLSACVIKSDKPISKADSDMYDTALNGTWYWKTSSETGFLHIGVESQGLYRILMVETNIDGKIDLEEYMAHISTIGANKYLNVLIDHKETDKGYLFVKYQVTKDGLELFIPDSSALEDAVESGKLKGTYSNNKRSTPRLVDSSERIAKFIGENDKKLYPEGKVLFRAKLEK